VIGIAPFLAPPERYARLHVQKYEPRAFLYFYLKPTTFGTVRSCGGLTLTNFVFKTRAVIKFTRIGGLVTIQGILMASFDQAQVRNNRRRWVGAAN
jgi:hypothetical protein